MGYADNLAAATRREQWEDFKQFYQPIAMELLNSTGYNDPSIYTTEVQDAQTRMGQAFDAAQGAQQRAIGRYGMTQGQDLQGEQAKLTGLARGLATTGIANQTRIAISDRDRQLMVGGLPNTGKAYGLQGGA